MTLTLIWVLLLIFFTRSQSPLLNAQLITPLNTAQMVVEGQASSLFVQNLNPFDCSLPPLYTYNQTTSIYRANTPYSISLSNLAQPTSINLTTAYNNFIVTYSPHSCSFPSCTLTIQNNCNPEISYNDYFDQVLLQIQGFPTTLTYYVKCNESYLGNTFQWGLVIEIVGIAILVTIVALYSNAWSLGGRGININIWLIIAFNLILIIGGVIGYLSQEAITICLDIVTFALGITGVAICANELLFLLRLKPLLILLFKLGPIEFRWLQILSLSIGTGATVGWWFSDQNMIVNDIICLCMTVGYIKILKFTSLKMALIAFTVTTAVELVVAILIFALSGSSYNSLFLNSYNYPF